MKKRTLGVVFCLISAWFFSLRYIFVVKLLPVDASYSSNLPDFILQVIGGTPLLIAAIVFFLIGIGYLAYAEITKE